MTESQTPAWANCIAAMPTDSIFFADLAAAVANDGTPEGGARWLIGFASQFLEREGSAAASPWVAFDLFIYDFEAMSELWPAFRLAAAQCPIPAEHMLPSLARFMVERLPNIWSGADLNEVAPVTKALALADRIDTLVCLFAAGLKPNGSKDPYALRRAAKEVLQMIVFPIQRRHAA